MKIPLLLACVAPLPFWLHAQSFTSDPVGVVAVEAPAHADTPLPVPMARSSVYHGFVTTVSDATLAVADAPGWKTGRFTTEPHYVRFETGRAAGRFYTVTANGADRLTIDWNGEASAAAGGDEFNVIPYWTLATLLPPAQAGRSFVASASPRKIATAVYLRDAARPGSATNSAVFFFHAGAWRKLGQPADADFGGTPVAPDAVLTIRNREAGTAVETTGTVSPVPASVVINAQGGTVRQDNELSLGIPASLTLAQSNLAGTEAFESSPSPEARRDELRIYSGENHINRLVAAYYHYNGAWRKVGAPAGENFDQTLIFMPGTRVVLNKAGTGGAPHSSYWTQPRLVSN